MRMKRWMASVLIIVVLWGVFGTDVCADESTSPEELKNLYARSAVLIDADSGRVLFGKEENVSRPMASTTKIMTCILALENMKENEIVQVTEYAASQPRVRLGVQEGESYYLKDLLYSLMLESHNDSAVVIAEYIGGSVETFAGMMNEKAKELGCDNTHFVTPNGLDAEDKGGVHSTTAKELALIMKYCIRDSAKKEEFLKITGTGNYSFTDVSGRREFSCNNHNAFLNMMEGAISGKTGFTGDAGYCYVGALENAGRTFIVALLACGWPNNKSYKWSDTRKLMTFGLEHYHYKTIQSDFTETFLKVENGSNPYVRLSAINETWQILLKDTEEVRVYKEVPENLKAPVKKGECVGSITYYLNGKVIRSFEICTREKILERTYIWCLKQIGRRFIKGDVADTTSLFVF